jgi:hypothetical protein
MSADVQIIFYTVKDFTDKLLASFLAENSSLSIEDYSNYIQNTLIGSPFSSDAIGFIASYDNGFLKPDKCDAYEPIRDKFDADNTLQPVKWLSQPGGAVFFLKRNSYKSVFENLRFTPVWQDGIIVPPSAKESEFIGEIRFYINQGFFKKKELTYWINFLKSLSKLLSASYAYIDVNNDSEFTFSKMEDVYNFPLDNFLISYYDKNFFHLLKDAQIETLTEKAVIKEQTFFLVVPNSDNVDMKKK